MDFCIGHLHSSRTADGMKNEGESNILRVEKSICRRSRINHYDEEEEE